MRQALASEFASKRRKRRRLRTGGKKDVGVPDCAEKISESNERKSYLDLLPDSVLDNIVRWVSNSPRSVAWSEHLKVPDIVSLFSAGGDIERVVRQRFTSLSFDTNSLFMFENEFATSDPFGLYLGDKKLSTSELLNLASPTYTALRVRDPISKYLKLPAKLDEFLEKCANVKALNVSSSSSRMWVERLGPRLEKLDIINPSLSVCCTIQSRCMQLRELRIKKASRKSLGRSQLWEKIGGTLEKLWISFLFLGTKEIQKIQQHCRKIRWLYIPNDFPVNEALTECIVSYGKQLEHAFLPDMNKEQLQSVVKACPNALFNMRLEEMSHYVSLKQVGKQLQEVVLFRDGIGNVDRLFKAWNACPNLKSITFADSYLSLKYTKAMFYKPKPLLTKLDLVIADDLKIEVEELQEIIDCVAKGTGALRTLSLDMPWLYVGLLDNLLTRNQSLEYVSCEADEFRGDHSLMSEIVKTILDVPNLNELFISTSPEEPEMCERLIEVVHPHRHRQLVITVDDNDYLA